MLYTNLIKTFLEGIGSNLGHTHIPVVLLREMLLDWFQTKYILCLIFPRLKVQIPAKGITHTNVLLCTLDLSY